MVSLGICISEEANFEDDDMSNIDDMSNDMRDRGFDVKISEGEYDMSLRKKLIKVYIDRPRMYYHIIKSGSPGVELFKFDDIKDDLVNLINYMKDYDYFIYFPEESHYSKNLYLGKIVDDKLMQYKKCPFGRYELSSTEITYPVNTMRLMFYKK